MFQLNQIIIWKKTLCRTKNRIIIIVIYVRPRSALRRSTSRAVNLFRKHLLQQNYKENLHLKYLTQVHQWPN